MPSFDPYLDGWIVAIAALAGVACALLGNFLVLRRMSMMGDAISHAVLPGLAVAFILTGERSSLPMFLGAAIVGVLTALFTEWVRGYGRVDEGASMGVVFTALFALGLVLMQAGGLDHVDLDASCVLYGAMEYAPYDTWTILGLTLPRVAVVLGVVTLINLAFVAGFYKELKLSSFDPALATSLGVSATFMHYALMTLVAVTAVAAFEAVGNILVVAVLIVPPAAAYLLTDRLPAMIALSAAFAVVAAVVGHAGAVIVPNLAGYDAVPTAGGVAVAAGVMFAAAVLLAPRHGVLSRAVARLRLATRIAGEDVLAGLYRARETGETAALDLRRDLAHHIAVWRLRRKGLLVPGDLALTDAGLDRGRQIVRAHRLWESYLDRHADVRPDHLHFAAERLEHADDPALSAALAAAAGDPSVDPHGREIPG